ncbi:MAG: ABC transporter ATP-binding protein [Verrucomicrobiota bacterium]
MISLGLAVACTGLVLVLPGVTMRFLDVIIPGRRFDLVFPTALLAIGAIAIRQALFTLRTYLNNSLEQKLTHDLRVEIYDKLQRLPVRWFDSNSSGEIMSRVANDVPTMDRVIIEGIDQSLAALLQFLIVLGYMAWLSWELTFVTLIPLPFIAILTSWWAKRSEPMWRASSEATSSLNSILHDQLAGIRQIKSYTVEPKALETFGTASRAVGEKHLRVMRGQAVVWPSVSFIAETGIILMVAFGSWWTIEELIVPGSTGMSQGKVLAFMVAWGFLFDPISRVNQLAQTFTRGMVSAKRVFDILDTCEESHLIEGERPDTVRGRVVFEDVSFIYDGESPAVSGLNIEAKPGETIALVGATGAGKSTVLNLITRFYEPNSGRILIDGTPLTEISKEWLRDQLGYVTQENFLFNTSVRENLLLAKLDASDDELWDALRAANAEGFVRRMPEGLDTPAGERGSRFSGGEKQRLSIARALLKNPPILLLDEATSALDTKTERLIQEALEHLRADRTCFVIAHRLSTVRQADRICVLEGGRLVESGNHDELLKLGGVYASLCEASAADDPRSDAQQLRN